MTKQIYQRHPLKRTKLGEQALRARLSLRETQREFAKRFRVSPITVHNWETGKTEWPPAIYLEILSKLVARLKDEGRYMPDEAFETIYRTVQEQRNELVAASN